MPIHLPLCVGCFVHPHKGAIHDVQQIDARRIWRWASRGSSILTIRCECGFLNAPIAPANKCAQEWRLAFGKLC